MKFAAIAFLILAGGCSFDNPKPAPLIDLGASPPRLDAVASEPEVAAKPEKQADVPLPLCQEIIFYTKIPECPPCVAMHRDGFEFEVAQAFGCRIGTYDEELLSGMPYVVVVMNDGQRIECHEIYQPKLETRSDRLKYLIAKIAKEIELYEVTK
ncbi:hypothetical protein [Kordiimonas sp.]|uniref:hypothetical protein n=1 Tax=Kordiimonas sp. TaxID=1970157 RepID=UPI003A902157